MDLFQDFKDLLAAFDASNVEFVLLGGYAVAFHGRPRSTSMSQNSRSADTTPLLDGDPGCACDGCSFGRWRG